MVLNVKTYPLVCKANEGFRISEIIRDFKKFTSKSIVKIIGDIPELCKQKFNKWNVEMENYELQTQNSLPLVTNEG